MSETNEDKRSWNIAGSAEIKSPVSGSQYHSSSSVEWLPTDTEGFWIKPLYEDPRRGEKTLLMKIAPGAYAPLHNHDGEFEQLYVLEGSFYDQHKTMQVGDYCCRSPDSFHSTGSKNGAVVVLVYTRR